MEKFCMSVSIENGKNYFGQTFNHWFISFYFVFFLLLFALRLQQQQTFHSFSQSGSFTSFWISIEHFTTKKIRIYFIFREWKNSLNAREREKICLICFLIIFEKKRSSLFICKRSNILPTKKSCYKATWFQTWNGIKKLFQPFLLEFFSEEILRFRDSFGTHSSFVVRFENENYQFHSV